MHKYDETISLKKAFYYAQNYENRVFLAGNELFLIFHEQPSLKYFDFLHEVRQCVCITFLYIFYFEKFELHAKWAK